MPSISNPVPQRVRAGRETFYGENRGDRNVSGNKVVSGNTVNVTQSNRRETSNQAQAALRERGGRGARGSTRAQNTPAQIGSGGGARARAR